MDLKSLRDHADECEAVAKERAETEGGGLHYMNTCDWAYAMAFREAANEIERQYRYARIVESYLDRETLKEVLTKWRASDDGRAHSASTNEGKP